MVSAVIRVQAGWSVREPECSCSKRIYLVAAWVWIGSRDTPARWTDGSQELEMHASSRIQSSMQFHVHPAFGFPGHTMKKKCCWQESCSFKVERTTDNEMAAAGRSTGQAMRQTRPQVPRRGGQGSQPVKATCDSAGGHPREQQNAMTAPWPIPDPLDFFRSDMGHGSLDHMQLIRGSFPYLHIKAPLCASRNSFDEKEKPDDTCEHFARHHRMSP